MALCASVVGAWAVIFDVAELVRAEKDATFAMAPISLGNPAAAATLKTRTGQPSSAETSGFEGASGLAPGPYEKTVRVKSGNTLSGLLTAAGIDRVEAADIVNAFSGAFDPRKIRAGQEITLRFTISEDKAADRFAGLSYRPTKLDVITVRRDADGYTARSEEQSLTTVLHQATGRIDDSLYMAGVRANLPVPVLIKLIRAYSWDVDFQRSIRKGDRFAVMYEARHDSTGAVIVYGDILFAELELSGDTLPLYRFTTGKGVTDYYDDKGRSAKKALMRTPIDGARLSSGFGNRKHPVLGYNKMHKGVDFAAARGTPIYAAGDGAVMFAGRKGGYGNFVKIRHNGEYSTAYAHMKGFAKGIKSGRRVRQGQVIGYVGSTGRSTGPHLHYEILKNGVQVNPMKVKMPSGHNLDDANLANFQRVVEKRSQQYATLAGLGATVAQN